MEITQLDKSGLDFITQFEAVRTAVYRDSAGIPSIGIGFTYYPDTGKKVTMQDPELSISEVHQMFLQMVKPFELSVYSNTRDDINQNQFNALVCLCYNIGTTGFKGSTVLRLVNDNIIGKPLNDAWLLWNKANHQISKGLTLRRQKEFELYIS